MAKWMFTRNLKVIMTNTVPVGETIIRTPVVKTHPKQK